ncbi:nucleotide pyrophosphatase/phosphodiesterase-like protein [Tanacetum coccineum]|uniref:Nucleotide pyrophosphatase/phosphodiesterase-like protein n=1 Tax=Tanacetum coccineum TaxID=301880 RepID=A0ABQ5H1N5_9ASTR
MLCDAEVRFAADKELKAKGRSFYDTPDSCRECGVPAETMYYVPADNRAKFWYLTDYGIPICIEDSEHDWREAEELLQVMEEKGIVSTKDTVEFVAEAWCGIGVTNEAKRIMDHVDEHDDRHILSDSKCDH